MKSKHAILYMGLYVYVSLSQRSALRILEQPFNLRGRVLLCLRTTRSVDRADERRLLSAVGKQDLALVKREQRPRRFRVDVDTLALRIEMATSTSTL